MEIDEIYREVAPKLQSYLTGNGCSYATACDIVQETFLRLWKQREKLSDDLHQVSGLAFTIARNIRNDMARRAQHEMLGGKSDIESDGQEVSGSRDEPRPGEEEEEAERIKRRLKDTLGRMPVQLLETFALSRLSEMSVRDIANGTGTSEANVKVRVHRAKELFRTCFSEQVRSEGVKPEFEGSESDILRAVMMLAAVDGEISREELALYRNLAEEFRGKNAAMFEELWERGVRAMAYIGFLSEMLQPEDLVREYAHETGRIPRQFIVALEQMAAVDGDYSRIERDCISSISH